MVLKRCNSKTHYTKNGKFYRCKSKNISIELEASKYTLHNDSIYRIAKLTDNHIGYLSVKLSNDKRYKNAYVHRLVYMTFVGPIPKGMQINHINHNKYDNRIENLEILTPSENQEKAILFYGEKKLRPKCKSCGKKVIRKNESLFCAKCKPMDNSNRVFKSKVKNKPTKEALEELIQKYPFTKIGKMYNVSNTAIKQWCKKYNLPFRKKDIYLYYNINKNK